MGFTHHWYRPQEIEPALYPALRSAFLSALNRYSPRVSLRGWDGRGSLDLTDADTLAFNGSGSQAHETFAFPRILDVGEWMPYEVFDGVRLYHQFCKTNQKPYDPVVRLCLALSKGVLGDRLWISSDDPLDSALWTHAASEASEILGEHVALAEIDDAVTHREPWPLLVRMFPGDDSSSVGSDL